MGDGRNSAVAEDSCAPAFFAPFGVFCGDRSAGGGHTSSKVVGGGGGWVEPESPRPHDQPSTSPSSTDVDIAPADDHIHPPAPSPRQYPQKSGYSSKQSPPSAPTPASRQTAPPPCPSA